MMTLCDGQKDDESLISEWTLITQIPVNTTLTSGDTSSKQKRNSSNFCKTQEDEWVTSAED